MNSLMTDEEIQNDEKHGKVVSIDQMKIIVPLDNSSGPNSQYYSSPRLTKTTSPLSGGSKPKKMNSRLRAKLNKSFALDQQ